MYEYRARLMARSNGRHPIYDGDTIWLEIDLGFGHLYKIGSCRLSFIDAPEMRGETLEAGRASRDHLRSLLSDLGWFTVKTYKDTKGKYGRYIVQLFLPDGQSLNQKMVEDGHAVFKEY